VNKEFFSKYNRVCELFLLKLYEYCKEKPVIESNKLFFDHQFRCTLKEVNEMYKNANYLKSGIRSWDMWYSTERWESVFKNLVKREFLIDEGNDMYSLNISKISELNESLKK
jgi:hypothetical protein